MRDGIGGYGLGGWNASRPDAKPVSIGRRPRRAVPNRRHFAATAAVLSARSEGSTSTSTRSNSTSRPPSPLRHVRTSPPPPSSAHHAAPRARVGERHRTAPQLPAADPAAAPSSPREGNRERQLCITDRQLGSGSVQDATGTQVAARRWVPLREAPRRAAAATPRGNAAQLRVGLDASERATAAARARDREPGAAALDAMGRTRGGSRARGAPEAPTRGDRERARLMARASRRARGGALPRAPTRAARRNPRRGTRAGRVDRARRARPLPLRAPMRPRPLGLARPPGGALRGRSRPRRIARSREHEPEPDSSGPLRRLRASADAYAWGSPSASSARHPRGSRRAARAARCA